MTGALRKGVVLLVVVFVGFYMFTDPNGLAALAKDGGAKLWDALQQLFSAIIAFLDAISS